MLDINKKSAQGSFSKNDLFTGENIAIQNVQPRPGSWRFLPGGKVRKYFKSRKGS